MESKRLIDMAVENVRDGRGGPFSCIIQDGHGKEIGIGCNHVAADCDPTAHAEIVALRDACKRINNFHLPPDAVVFSSCEPCPMCRTALLWAGAKKIIYLATRHDADRAGFSDKLFYENPSDHFVHLPHPDAFRPFAEWIGSNNKIDYDPSI